VQSEARREHEDIPTIMRLDQLFSAQRSVEASLIVMAVSRYAYVRDFELPDNLLPRTFIILRIDGHAFNKCPPLTPVFHPSSSHPTDSLISTISRSPTIPAASSLWIMPQFLS
jgi:hypothetical protein